MNIGRGMRALGAGEFRQWAFWISMALVVESQIPVAGWLTTLSAHTVLYNGEHPSGTAVRWMGSGETTEREAA